MTQVTRCGECARSGRRRREERTRASEGKGRNSGDENGRQGIGKEGKRRE